MSQATQILTELRWRGVCVTVEGDILCLKPRRALDDRLLARVRNAKPALLEILRNDPPDSTPTADQVAKATACWHCCGLGECNCSTCGVMKPSVVWSAGECVACKSRKTCV